jgi:hypothetical protein
MRFDFQRFVLIAGLSLPLFAAALTGQHTKANSNPPADPQAKTSQPATHFTQGTIASIDANRMVIARKVRGKEELTSFTLDSQTERNGNLAAGTRVSVQYREDNGQKVAAGVRELTARPAAPPEKTALRSRSKG